jgi:hypothetical protein
MLVLEMKIGKRVLGGQGAMIAPDGATKVAFPKK